MAPYLELGERLGKFLTATFGGKFDSIHIAYAGALAEMRTEMIRNAALCGLLGSSGHANRINASSVAEGQGIHVHEEKAEAGSGGVGSVLKLTVHTGEQAEQRSMTVSGTVLHGKFPRLLACDGIDIEAPLDGTLLFISNQDVPGVIGRIGTILGEHAINIANFALGRAEVNGAAKQKREALAVVHVDALTENSQIGKALEAVGALPAIRSVKLVKLK